MNLRRAAAGAILALALATAAARATPLDASAFAYANEPLDVTTLSTQNDGGTIARIVTFRSGSQTLHAEIVAPAASTAAGPGVLFVHWLGDARTTNHTEFERDAIALARRGATCVLLDAMWSTLANGDADWFSKVRSTATDYAASVAQVIGLRRALDLLLAQPHVDPARIAYVGHDFGAMYGAVLSGVDPRPSYYLLMAGTTTFSQWYLLGKRPADVAAYVMQMQPLDPLPYLHRAKAKAFAFQFAETDQYVSAQHRTAFFDAAPLPKALFLYAGGHDLAVPEASADRLAWLEARLF